MGKWDEVSSLAGLFSQLGIARRHLFQAGREVLLLFQSLLELADRYAEGATKDVLSQVKGLTTAVLDKLPDGDEKKAEEMRQAIFQSILGVLEVEIGRFSRSTSPKTQLKREALETIVTTLRKEMGGKKGKIHHAAA
ncbi:MAG: hypothetical protein HYT76_00990 [Deltaproteobacteria bacterium]|nr:hypothetical protein [Deltaproteobacteria bacterium]